MDVSCGRCKTEYEFDDALISERGTTVRCTNCGLEFKIFPPGGRHAPEIWEVRADDTKTSLARRYESLADLQRAISRGEVHGSDYLTRGDESPRRLASIAELEPLLRQPKSAPPPGVAPVRKGSGTTLGLPALSNRPVIERRAPPPARPKDDDDPIVVPPLDDGGLDRTVRGVAPPADAPPPLPSETEVSENDFEDRDSDDELAADELELDEPDAASIPPSSGSRGPESIAPESPARRRIQSALSQYPASSDDAPDSEREPDSSRSSRPNLPSLASTLLTKTPGAVLSSGPSAPPAERRNSSLPPSPLGRISAAPATPRGSRPSEPRISDSGQYPGQLTPTPTGLRALGAEASRGPLGSGPISSPLGGPVSAGPSSLRGRGARSGLLIGSVLLGGGLFFFFTGGEKVRSVVGSAQDAAPTARAEDEAKLPAELANRLVEGEVAYLRLHLLTADDPRRAEARRLLEEKAPRWLAELAAISRPGPEVIAAHIDCLRWLGKTAEARRLVSSGAPPRPYTLALLDLAETPEGTPPPWPSIVSRLEEARTGERGDYVATSALLYALGASGQVESANAKLDELGALEGGKSAPLYADLSAYLARLSVAGSSSEVEVPPVELSGEPAATDRVEWTPPPKKSSPVIGPEVQSLVDEADTLWRGGNREGAIALYRQVVAKAGTKHFLGQRAAARIAQAERERGSSGE